MFDPFDEAHRFAQRLVTAVTGALGRAPAFDGLLTRPELEVVVVNAVADEREHWTQAVRSTGGSAIRVIFVTRGHGPHAIAFALVAARGCGTLDFQHFECGCRAAQIPGEDDWQLVRSTFCRFATSGHAPRSWPLDALVQPIQRP